MGARSRHPAHLSRGRLLAVRSLLAASDRRRAASRSLTGGRPKSLSSGLTRVAYPNFAACAAAKGAVEVVSLYPAKELGGCGIAVSTVAPGTIETDFLGGAVRDTPGLNRVFAEMTALGRVGLPDDAGPMIASLPSEENRRVDAQRIEVSGGQGIRPGARPAAGHSSARPNSAR